MNTEVRIAASKDGDLFANVASVPVLTGNTVSFIAPPETGIVLCMSARTAEALSRRAASTRVEIEAQGRTLFHFSTSPPGDYWLFVQRPNSACMPDIPEDEGGDAPVLQIGIGPGGAESGPGDDTRNRGG